MHKKFPNRELIISYLTMMTTLVLMALSSWQIITILIRQMSTGSALGVTNQIWFIILIISLFYGSITYQLERIGYLKRLKLHKHTPKEQLEELYANPDAPPVVMLVPSYKEEAKTILQTLFSAATQEYPKKRVVLLIDNPPHPEFEEDKLLLRAAKQIPGEVQTFFDELLNIIESAQAALKARSESTTSVHHGQQLAALHEALAHKFRQKAQQTEQHDHTDLLFINHVFLARAKALESNAHLYRNKTNIAEISQVLQQLKNLYSVELSYFERKRFANLSHEANKAMNLNSYISLIGKSFITTGEDDLTLQQVDDAHPDCYLSVPDAVYIVTLDADSFLMPRYVPRLVHYLEQPAHHRVAIAQTPYNAIPDAPGILERTAGATTDIQHILDEGSSYFNGAYWVGANAVIRKAALTDIQVLVQERGFDVTKFIQDNTVIEDTESTVDLLENGWQIYNYPGHGAYSATPADFGALLIQRRRWANGGLLILPKLFHYLRKKAKASAAVEGFMRIHYLTSLAGVNTAILFIFMFPFEANLRNPWLPLTAVPYYYLFGRDLALIGRKFRDVIDVYAFNLLLILVNLGGVLKSVEQILTGRKSSFGRTPKVEGRTSAPKAYIMAELLLLGLLLVATSIDLYLGNWMHAIFSFFNGLMLLYAITIFMGWQEIIEDLGLSKPSLTRKVL